MPKNIIETVSNSKFEFAYKLIEDIANNKNEHKNKLLEEYHQFLEEINLQDFKESIPSNKKIEGIKNYILYRLAYINYKTNDYKETRFLNELILELGGNIIKAECQLALINLLLNSDIDTKKQYVLIKIIYFYPYFSESINQLASYERIKLIKAHNQSIQDVNELLDCLSENFNDIEQLLVMENNSLAIPILLKKIKSEHNLLQLREYQSSDRVQVAKKLIDIYNENNHKEIRSNIDIILSDSLSIEEKLIYLPQKIQIYQSSI